MSVTQLSAIPKDTRATLIGVSDLARSLSALEKLVAQHPQMPVVLLWEGKDMEALIAAMRLGISDVVSSISGLGEALERACSRKPAKECERPGRLVAIFSLKGGIGKTAVSTNLAIALHRLSGLSVSAIDLSLPCGNMEMYLDVCPSRTISDLLEAGDDIDATLVGQALARHSSGISLIAGPRPGQQEALANHSCEALLRVLCEEKGLVVVDMGSFVETAHASVLAMADMVIVPTTPLISSLGVLPQARTYLSDLGVEEKRILPILNHACPNLESPPTPVLHRLMGGKPRFELPYGGSEVSASLNAGMPVSQHQPRSPLARSIEVLGRDILVQFDLLQQEKIIERPASKPPLLQRLMAWLAPKGVAHVHP